MGMTSVRRTLLRNWRQVSDLTVEKDRYWYGPDGIGREAEGARSAPATVSRAQRGNTGTGNGYHQEQQQQQHHEQEHQKSQASSIRGRHVEADVEGHGAITALGADADGDGIAD